MQKKIIALAVAGLMSGAAFAQSNVTVYGQVDMGYYNTRSDMLTSAEADHTAGIGSGLWGASRLGFKGEEALGNGLKAMFTLEYGLRADAAAGVGSNLDGTGNAREQTVGLSGDFGMVKAGYQTTLGHIAMNKFDAARATAFSALNSLRATSISVSNRHANMIQYVSPKLMGGLTLSGTYAFSGVSSADTTAYGATGTTTNNDQERVIGFMADYTAGPLALAYVHHRINDVTNLSGYDNREHMLGASYDFGVVKLFGTYQTDRRSGHPTTPNLAATEWQNRVYQLGLQLPINEMSRVDFNYANFNRKEDVTNVARVSDNDAKSWAIQYSYNLSKRTMAYAGYTRVSNDNPSSATGQFTALRGASAATGGDYGVAPTDIGGDSRGWGVGLRHNF